MQLLLFGSPKFSIFGRFADDAILLQVIISDHNKLVLGLMICFFHFDL